MPMYDRVCGTCKIVKLDSLERIQDSDYHLCGCGGEMARGFTGKGASVIGDDIPGGLAIKNGLCHDDGTPRTFYTKSAIREEAARQGLTWGSTEHVPSRGSDKNKHTTRWI